MKTENIFAITEQLTTTGYPSYLSINTEGNEAISISVRTRGSANASMIILGKEIIPQLLTALTQYCVGVHNV